MGSPYNSLFATNIIITNEGKHLLHIQQKTWQELERASFSKEENFRVHTQEMRQKNQVLVTIFPPYIMKVSMFTTDSGFLRKTSGYVSQIFYLCAFSGMN